MAKDKDDLPKISLTRKVFLVGPDTDMLIGEFTLTEVTPGPRAEDFADAAFKSARASLQRLMAPLLHRFRGGGRAARSLRPDALDQTH